MFIVAYWHRLTAPVTGLCAQGFNFLRVYEIRVASLKLEHSDASTRSRRKASSGEAPKENEFVFFALIAILLVIIQLFAESSAGGGRKKLSAFNKFMQSEMARLKESDPDMPHQER